MVQATVPTDDIGEWLANEALSDTEAPQLVAELSRRAREIGIPVIRMQAVFNIAHPLYSASAIRWTPDEGVVTETFSESQRTTAAFQRSPINFAIKNRLAMVRRRLAGPTAQLDFPVLDEFKAAGGTDYLLFLQVFDVVRERGIACSWVTDRPEGFDEAEVAQLRLLTRALAIALKTRIERSIAENVAHAYFGRQAGQAVLNGSIRRGDAERIGVALWYSDLRGSTRLTDSLSPEGFLQVINSYFEMTAGAVMDGGGEVVQFVGDSVLGFFRVDGDAGIACGKALAAAHEARRRLAAHEPAPGVAPLRFGISLHLGEVIYGNAGTPERLQFSLIGAPIVEVVRVQDLTKQLGASLLATGPFARQVDCEWRDLGEHPLRGFDRAMPILTPAET